MECLQNTRPVLETRVSNQNLNEQIDCGQEAKDYGFTNV